MGKSFKKRFKQNTKMDKKAELTSKQLVTIIILIISFAIIILFFVSLNLRETIDSEACRNSVILRGSLPLGADTVQLKCKTNDVCLSMGGDCGIERKDLVTVKVDDEDELVEEMVNLLWDCWWMMGEGKVNYIPSGIGFDETYCTLCDKVYFDDEIKEKYKEEGGIPYALIYNYMQSVKVPEKDESFLFSIYKLNSLESIREGLLVEQGYDIYEYKLDPEQEQVIVTAIMESTSNVEIVGGVIGGLVGSVVGFFVPGSHFITIPSIASAGAAAGIWFGEEEIKYLTPRYVEFKGEALESLDCKEYVSEG